MKKRSIHKYIFEWSKLSNKLISEIYYEKKRSALTTTTTTKSKSSCDLSLSTSSLLNDPHAESLKHTSNPLPFQVEVLNLGCLPFAQTSRVEILRIRDWSKSMGGGGVGRSREGVGHEVLSLVHGVGRVIFSYP